jgi:hypothetical protein
VIAHANPAGHADPLRSLQDALRSEQNLVEDLAGLVRRQRESLATDDLKGVEDTVYATHRVLLTLREAQRRRRTLNRLIGWPEGIRLTGMDDALAGGMDEALREARDGLCDAARRLTREVELNRAVLRASLAATDEYARVLHGGPSTEGGYRAPAEGIPMTTLLDRTG